MIGIGSHVYVYRCKNIVRTVYGSNSRFEVKVGMHQGSAFVIVTCYLLLSRKPYLENLELPYLGSCCMLMTWL